MSATVEFTFRKCSRPLFRYLIIICFRASGSPILVKPFPRDTPGSQQKIIRTRDSPYDGKGLELLRIQNPR
jgi:hypothetical protein